MKLLSPASSMSCRLIAGMRPHFGHLALIPCLACFKVSCLKGWPKLHRSGVCTICRVPTWQPLEHACKQYYLSPTVIILSWQGIDSSIVILPCLFVTRAGRGGEEITLLRCGCQQTSCISHIIHIYRWKHGYRHKDRFRHEHPTDHPRYLSNNHVNTLLARKEAPFPSHLARNPPWPTAVRKAPTRGQPKRNYR